MHMNFCKIFTICSLTISCGGNSSSSKKTSQSLTDDSGESSSGDAKQKLKNGKRKLKPVVADDETPTEELRGTQDIKKDSAPIQKSTISWDGIAISGTKNLKIIPID